MKFKAYHKIRQFKDIIRDIQFQSNYKGMDENGEHIYENSRKPILNFIGTVKLHGTNAGICYTPEKGIVAQKRNSFLNPEQLEGHFGFNQFVQVTQKENLLAMMEGLWLKYCKEGEQITLYGEWAGSNIQKGVGISETKKAFYYFDCKVYNLETEEERWVDITNFDYPSIDSIYNINNFTVYTQKIDFNNPALSQNSLVELTNKVEKECPVAKAFGKIGVGEGIVWTCYWEGRKYIFKVKGKKHSTSKVKKLAAIDPEVVKNIYEFVDYACTENRINQGIQEVEAKEKKDIPDLLRWVANDIMTEEDDVLQRNNLEWKQVAREVSSRVRQYFFAKIDKI